MNTSTNSQDKSQPLTQKPEASTAHAQEDFNFHWPWNWIVALLVATLLAFAGDSFLNPYVINVLVYAGINVILAVSLNYVIGFTGQFSMGHAGFVSIGAYSSAMVSLWLTAKVDFFNSQMGAWFLLVIAMIVGGLAAGLVGYLVGLPSLRLKGDYLAIVTLGFGEIIRVALLNIDSVGGARGLPGIPVLANLSAVTMVAVITIFTIWRAIHSIHGRAQIAVREDEIAAQAMGVNTTKAKVHAFTIGAFFAGVGGVLYAHYLAYLIPSTFDFNRSFEIIIMVVLGGMGSISGSVVTALFLTVIKEQLRVVQDLINIDIRMILFSMLLIFVMLTRPSGLFGNSEFNFFFKKITKRFKPQLQD